MQGDSAIPQSIDEYIAGFPRDIQAILKKVRKTVQAAAPDAEEIISYRMPAFRQKGVLVYFAAFNHHIGLYPPVSGDADLEKAVAPYSNEKGNLRFPFERPIPYELIARIVRMRVKQNEEKAAATARVKAAARKNANAAAKKNAGGRDRVSKRKRP